MDLQNTWLERHLTTVQIQFPHWFIQLTEYAVEFHNNALHLIFSIVQMYPK